METLYVFGTGNAQAFRCYNTCFAIRSGDEYFMTDAGGGNGILAVLEDMEVPISRIHHLFVSHAYTDHILGVVWMIRMVATAMKKKQYEGKFHIYCHQELVSAIHTLCELTIQKKFCRLLDDTIVFHTVKDGSQREILGCEVTFFDIQSTKAKQFGFTATLHNKRLLCFAGDEPLQKNCYRYAAGADWLLHEAFCCYAEREQFQPYEKHHSTAKDACELAGQLAVKRLVLWHTEDLDLPHRREKYNAERGDYAGELYLPDDRERLEL